EAPLGSAPGADRQPRGGEPPPGPRPVPGPLDAPQGLIGPGHHRPSSPGGSSMRGPRVALSFLAFAVLGPSPARAEEPKWKQHTINGRSGFEAAGVLDVDHDGRLDIVSGETWYRAPDWTPSRVRDVSATGKYFNCFATLPLDVNADGRTDYVTC